MRKTYKKSDKCELVYTPVAWNIKDPEQLRDLEFIEASVNKAGRIRECVRIVRKGGSNHTTFPAIPDTFDADIEEETISLEESLNRLVD
jgi:hypothetical protein